MTTQPTLTPAEFAKKWRGVTTTEKASSQSHFIDLCRMLGEPTPHDADPTGSHYAFEKRVTKAGGGEGFADVWKRDFFAWEYKGSYRDLRAAYVQLLGYKDDLGNPPLLIVSDMERIEIRTNFTGLSPVLKVITLDDLAGPGKPQAGPRAPCVRPALASRLDPRGGAPGPIVRSEAFDAAVVGGGAASCVVARRLPAHSFKFAGSLQAAQAGAAPMSSGSTPMRATRSASR